MTARPPTLTLEDFAVIAAQSEPTHRLLELIDGKVVEKVPTELHGIIAAAVARLLGNFVEERNLNGFVSVEARFQAAGDRYNSRLPDVAYRRASPDQIVTRGAVMSMPDLAVEIRSPDDSLDDMQAKAQFYLRHGARLVWLIDAEAKGVEVVTLTAHGNPQRIFAGLDDHLDGGDVLPGLRLPVRRIFPASG
jgi:Uma2 family endonuclease